MPTKIQIWEEFQKLRTEVKRQYGVLPANARRRDKKATIQEALEALKKYTGERSLNRLIQEGKYNQVMTRVIDNRETLNQRQATAMWNKIQQEGRYSMRITKKNGESKVIALNQNTLTYFSNLLMYGVDFEQEEEYGSDIMDSYNFNELASVEIIKMPKPVKELKNKAGGFFPLVNNSEIDLSEYQIYTKEQIEDMKKGERIDQCLIHTLKGQVDEALLNKVKLTFIGKPHINRKDLQKVVEIICRDIIVFYYDNKDTKIRKKHYEYLPPEHVKELFRDFKPYQDTPIKITIYRDHYFKYHETKYSTYSIEHYNEVKDKPDFHNLYMKGKRKKNRKISSLNLIKMLDDQGFFIKGDLSKLEDSVTNSEIRDDVYLDRIEEEQRPVDSSRIFKSNSKSNTKSIKSVYYADCESYVYTPVHRLYLLGYVSNKNDITTILNVENMEPQNIVTKWLSDMTSGGKTDALCYFHNLKYDYHILEYYLPMRDKIVKDNAMYSVTLKYKGRTIELRDSFKLIPFALSKFGKNFNLDAEYRKKEAIAYTYYTPENNDVRIPTAEYRKLLSIDEQNIFDTTANQCMSFYTTDNGIDTFNPLTYYIDYLRLDCLVLKYGMKKFNEIILDVTDKKLSIYDCLTISSLTDKYMIMNGAYDDIYEVSGNLREYIGRAVYGGRVCVNEKYKKKVIEGKISDYDGVSLYPSAINRLCREVGLPKGKAVRFTPEQLKNQNQVLDFWKDTTYAVMTIKITKVNKYQQMPFIAYKDTKQGSTQYLNTPPPEDIIIDKFTLEDYIKFHDIEYQILDGVYWNNGGNKTMGKLIQKLFNERLKHKKTNPALANTLKLMLNSSYGKTILKKSESENKIIKVKLGDESKFHQYVYNHFFTIKKYRKINDYYYEVERTCCDDSFNRAHIGASILSYSKRIMNEVFDTANTHNYPIYYTDTDSIHMNFDDVQPLETKYRETYNRELNGKNLEQFHIDFELDGACSEIYATKSIFLGKKSYIDMLESTDSEGKTITGYHKRLKGITKEGLEHTAKQYSGYFELYEELAKGKEIEIVLNPYNVEKNKTKVLFEFKDGTVSTKQKFIRKVRF